MSTAIYHKQHAVEAAKKRLSQLESELAEQKKRLADIEEMAITELMKPKWYWPFTTSRETAKASLSSDVGLHAFFGICHTRDDIRLTQKILLMAETADGDISLDAEYVAFLGMGDK